MRKNEADQKQFDNLVERVTYDIEAAIQRAINAAPEKSMHFPLMLNASNAAVVMIAKKLAVIKETPSDLTKNQLILLAALLTFRYAITDTGELANLGRIMEKAIEDFEWISGGDGV